MAVFLCDESFLDHLDCDAHGGETGAFAVAGLQDVEAVVFDGELEVLHVLEMLLEERRDFHERLVRSRHFLGELRDRMRRAHARHDVFALGVDQIFAVEDFLAGRRITSKGNAGRARVAHVAEDHRLHIDRRAPVVGNAVFAAVDDGAVVVPGAEDCADRAPELFARILRKAFAGAFLDQLLELPDEFLQIVDGQLDVGEIVIAVTFVFEVLDHAFERLMIFARALLHAHHDVAVHLQKPAVGIPGEARVPGLLCATTSTTVSFIPRLRIVSIMPGIESRAPERTETSNGRSLSPSFFPTDFSTFASAASTAASSAFGIGALVFGEVSADFGRDGETWRDRQTDACHLGEVGAFAAEERFHVAGAIGLAVAKVIYLAARFPGSDFGFALAELRTRRFPGHESN